MPNVNLTDDEVVNLVWLLNAIGAGAPSNQVDHLANARGPWAFTAISKLAAVCKDPSLVTAFRSIDWLRQAVGRFVATTATQQQVDALTATVAAYAARDNNAYAALDQLKIPYTKTGVVVATPFTDACTVAGVAPVVTPVV